MEMQGSSNSLRDDLHLVNLNSPESIEVQNRHWLKLCIENGDLRNAVVILRLLTQPLPVEIYRALADLADPDRPTMKTGPKAGRNHNRDMIIWNSYVWLRSDDNLAAQVVFNVDLAAFNKAEPFDCCGCVYPQLHGDQLFLGEFVDTYSLGRVNLRKPSVTELRSYIERRCGVSSRTLDTILSKSEQEKREQVSRQILHGTMAEILAAKKGLAPPK